MLDRDTLVKILDLARWAPSGDNTQPWRFEIIADDHVAVHGFDTRDHVIYDFEGRASHMAHGALLETLRIAATGFGLSTQWSIREGSSDTTPVYDVRLRVDAAQASDPLFPYIETRTTQRRPMKTTPLTSIQRDALARAPGSGFEVVFIESLKERRRVAHLLWDSARIRLTCPEAYQVHRDVIEWNARFSDDRIPDQAVGVDPVTARLMRWVMKSWERVDFFNRYLFGTVAPGIQLDFLPGLLCASHAVIVADSPPTCLKDFVAAGVALQRLWLTADSLGLSAQPEMTPLIFSWYVKEGQPVSALESVNAEARRVAVRLETELGESVAMRGVFICRLGGGRRAVSRSRRMSLETLYYADSFRAVR